MGYGKVRGTCWCHSCQKEQTSFLTKIVHYEDREEVLGVCSVCSHPVKRIISAAVNHEVVEESGVCEEAAEKKEEPPVVSTTSDQSRKTLPILLTLTGLLLIVLTFN